MDKIEYVRCPNCSCVYNQDLGKCPECGELVPVDESINNEPIFNIND